MHFGLGCDAFDSLFRGRSLHPSALARLSAGGGFVREDAHHQICLCVCRSWQWGSDAVYC